MFVGVFLHHCGEYNFCFFIPMDLLLLLLEAGIALMLLLGIVWWTWPRSRPEDEKRDDAKPR